MLFLVWRKISNNKWLVACLLIGSILAVSMVSSVPLYTGGILQRMLVKDLEQYQLDKNTYPGRIELQLNAYTFYQGGNRAQAYDWFDYAADNLGASKLGLPYTEVKRDELDYMTILPVVQREEKPKTIYAELVGMTDSEKHVDIVAGRLPSNTPVDGVYEVMANDLAQLPSGLNINLGEELTMTDQTKQIKPITVKIVGLYRQPQSTDVWWDEPDTDLRTALLMNYGLLKSDIISKSNAITKSYRFFYLDYTKLKVENLKPFVDQLDGQQRLFTQYAGITYDFPAKSILDSYTVRSDQLRITLWVLQVPILLILAFYIFMVSQLIVENDRNEIAVIRSRGAAGYQIFGSYLLQSALLSLVSVIVGPAVAMGICEVLGASNGFLELVARTALPLSLNLQTVAYAFVAGCFSVVMMMIPAVRASRVTIVEHKQKRARKWNAPLWQKMFLDFILLGVSLYGLYQYGLRQKAVLVTAAKDLSVPVDPFLFLISTAFVVGLGLLFLRLYPLLIRFISWVGVKIWPPVVYTTLTQVGRSSGREQFLMLFLIMTISIGIFNANSARTINQNIIDKVTYRNGADLTLQMKWQNNAPTDPSGPPSMGGDTSASINTTVTYIEPDFDVYSKLAGTTAAAKVYVPDSATTISGPDSKSLPGKLLAMIPNQFGNVVWSSPNLLPHHINEYLNLMALSPDAVLVSRQLMKDLNLKVGDHINYRWGEQDSADGVVYASVDYWPSLNPYAVGSQYFVIANLNYIQAYSPVEPYQIWYKTSPNASTKAIYDDIEAKKMQILQITDTKQDIVRAKNDPLLQGTNGAMTLGFLVTLAISMIGFFIYWILSIQSRTLQFGIFRAMGMSAGRVLGMLILEQILISGAAILVGIIIGGVMSRLFVPLLGIVYGAQGQVPPFEVMASRADYIRIYSAVGAMLAAGLALLGALISRIKISQAIKLGED